jgi:putative membrane protein
MSNTIGLFFLHWTITSLSLWMVSYIFDGIRFSSRSSLIVSALILGFLNAILRPILVFLTFPLTLISFGLFLLVINALLLILASKLVRGFTVSGFGTAFFGSIFLTIFSLLLAFLS